MGKKQQQQKKKQSEVADPASDDDSSIASDDAFDSEDERRYGSFFDGRKKANSGDDHYDESDSNEDEEDSDVDDEDNDHDEEESDSNDDDDDVDDGDGGDYMLSLLDKLDEDKRDIGNKRDSRQGIAAHTKESEFSASVVKKGDLTLDALMGSIQDTAGYGQVQKQLKHVAQGEATSVPVARVISDRLQRKLNYETQCKDVSQWMDIVQQNRQAETLDFRPKQRLVVTQQGLVDGFTPTTDFEKQIHAALQKAGQEDEETILKREHDRLQDDLDANEITLDEYKKRRSDLAKMRALMFYHEQKRHHINKIKSKKYRRIRKRQRERLMEGEALDEDPEKLKEQEEVERIKERASLAHKNTSKWAKRVLKRGNKVDINTRKALSESLRRGDDLMKRMKSTRDGEESSDSDGDDLVASAKAVLAGMDDDTDLASGKAKGVFQMSFMQKGIEKQKARAREEARQLLKELEEDEKDGAADPQQREDEPTAKKVRMSSKKEMQSVLRESDLVVASLKLGQKHEVAVSGHLAIALDGSGHGVVEKSNGKALAVTVSEHSLTVEQTEASEISSSLPSKTNDPPVSANQHRRAVEDDDGANPWLMPPAESVSSEKKATKRRGVSRGHVDVEGAVDILESTSLSAVKGPTVAIDSMTATDDDETTRAISNLSQGELVRRAFASVASLEEEEFSKEKERVADDEDPTRKQLQKEAKSAASKGWGSWTGMGAPAPKPARKLPKKLQPPEPKLGKRVRADEKKPNVILSEKRMKKLANNYMLSAVPYPFTSREEYEKAMSGSLGKEFNVTAAFKDMTRPAVITRPGKVIQPISKTSKVRRAAAKF